MWFLKPEINIIWIPYVCKRGQKHFMRSNLLITNSEKGVRDRQQAKRKNSRQQKKQRGHLGESGGEGYVPSPLKHRLLQWAWGQWSGSSSWWPACWRWWSAIEDRLECQRPHCSSGSPTCLSSFGMVCKSVVTVCFFDSCYHILLTITASSFWAAIVQNRCIF